VVAVRPGISPVAVESVEGDVGESVPEVVRVVGGDAADVQPRGAVLDRIGQRPGCGVPQLRPETAGGQDGQFRSRPRKHGPTVSCCGLRLSLQHSGGVLPECETRLNPRETRLNPRETRLNPRETRLNPREPRRPPALPAAQRPPWAWARRSREGHALGNGTLAFMESRRVGTSGLRVSSVVLGTMTWARDTDEHESADLLREFLDSGGTLVDTAASYSEGAAEEVIGTLLADEVD